MHDATGALGPALGWLTNTFFSAVLGVMVGALVVVVLHLLPKRRGSAGHAGEAGESHEAPEAPTVSASGRAGRKAVARCERMGMRVRRVRTTPGVGGATSRTLSRTHQALSGRRSMGSARGSAAMRIEGRPTRYPVMPAVAITRRPRVQRRVDLRQHSRRVGELRPDQTNHHVAQVADPFFADLLRQRPPRGRSLRARKRLAVLDHTVELEEHAELRVAKIDPAMKVPFGPMMRIWSCGGRQPQLWCIATRINDSPTLSHRPSAKVSARRPAAAPRRCRWWSALPPSAVGETGDGEQRRVRGDNGGGKRLERTRHRSSVRATASHLECRRRAADLRWRQVGRCARSVRRPARPPLSPIRSGARDRAGASQSWEAEHGGGRAGGSITRCGERRATASARRR